MGLLTNNYAVLGGILWGIVTCGFAILLFSRRKLFKTDKVLRIMFIVGPLVFAMLGVFITTVFSMMLLTNLGLLIQ